MDEGSSEPNIGREIEGRGWRTGAACSPSAMEGERWIPEHILTIARQKLTDGQLWVPMIVSQACDLVHNSLDLEPHAEFILAKLGMKKDPALADMRTYRRLQLEHPKLPYAEFRVHHRWVAERKLLLTLPRQEDFDLAWEHGLRLGKWIGSRYARLPLPNALVMRMDLANDGKVKKILTQLNDGIHEIRINVTPANQELLLDEPYNVTMHVIAKTTTVNSPAVTVPFEDLRSWAKKLKGVTLQVKLVSADGFSYSEFQKTHRLDLDSFTFGHLDGEHGGVPVVE